MLQDNQVQIKLGTKKDGTPQYGNLTNLITPLVPIKDTEKVDIALGADSDQFTISTAPAGNIYLDGSCYESINGGFIATNGRIGVANTDTVKVGERIANISVLYDDKNDEVIYLEKDPATDEVIGRKIVHALLSTDLADGDATSNNHLQLSFVIYDDNSNALKNVEIEAGNYKVFLNKAYNRGTLALAQEGGNVLHDFDLGGYAEDELLDLNKPVPFYVTAKINSDTNIPTDNIVKVVIGADAGNTHLEDSGGNTIDATISQLETVVFTDIGKTFYESIQGVCFFGVHIPPLDCTIEATNTLKIDLSNVIATSKLYQGNILTVQGVK